MINFSSGFKITSNEAVDERIIKTKEEMRNMTSADLARMPENYFCMCADDGQIYFYSVDNPVSEETGKFKAFDSTVASDIENSEEVKGALTTNITNNISNDTGVQSALGSAISGNSDIQSAIGGVISTNPDIHDSIANVVENSEAVKSSIADVVKTDEGVKDSIADVVENSEAVQESIASAISTNEDIQAQIDASIQKSLDNGKVEVPKATNVVIGTVVGDEDGKNKVSVKEDSTMEINSVGVEKLSNTEGVRLILNGGKAPVIS